MAGPSRHVPSYHDPVQTFENFSDESLDINFEFPDDFPGGENILLDEDITRLHDRENIMLNEDMNQFGHGTSQAGPSGGFNDQSNEHMSGRFNPEIPNFGNPIQLLQWPVPTEPYSCSCCQVLREIIHTIDGETRKFEIHGRVGEIFHGILEICRRDMTASTTEYQMFDFCKETITDVKEFLVQYCEERTEAGYTIVKDPLLAFNEALKVGSDWEFGLDDHFFRGSLTDTDEDTDDDSQPQAGRNKRRSKGKEKKASKKASKKTKTKTDRAYQEQREFIKELKLKDFVDYFNLKLEDAAEKVGICPTALKNICRDAGFRWPHRKIQMYERKIQQKRMILESSADVRKKEIAEAEIKELEQLIANYAAPFKNK